METYMASRRDGMLAKIQGNPFFLATQDPQGGVGGGSNQGFPFSNLKI
jgi:hypothetical protein